MNESTTYHVECHACGQSYDQTGGRIPSLCGACGSDDITAIDPSDRRIAHLIAQALDRERGGWAIPGEEQCPECGHALRRHGPDGCHVERGDGYRHAEFVEALGPCPCRQAGPATAGKVVG
jgi:hypothetical protein